jgi:hypothetical protein
MSEKTTPGPSPTIVNVRSGPSDFLIFVNVGRWPRRVRHRMHESNLGEVVRRACIQGVANLPQQSLPSCRLRSSCMCSVESVGALWQVSICVASILSLPLLQLLGGTSMVECTNINHLTFAGITYICLLIPPAVPL